MCSSDLSSLTGQSFVEQRDFLGPDVTGEVLAVFPYYKLQCWENGKYFTRYIRPEEIPLLNEALAGQARFEELTQQYAHLVIAETREQLASGSKKKTPLRNYSSPKKPKSSS